MRHEITGEHGGKTTLAGPIAAHRLRRGEACLWHASMRVLRLLRLLADALKAAEVALLD